MTDQERILLLLATLRGLRDMAQLEADAGSPTWAKCVVLIDQTLLETEAA